MEKLLMDEKPDFSTGGWNSSFWKPGFRIKSYDEDFADTYVCPFWDEIAFSATFEGLGWAVFSY